ncbi:MAG: hypothetical protein OEY97_04000 [Nitrospirota bacterium]|nr:hypothetical protein [Nitrospirota bacterium]
MYRNAVNLAAFTLSFMATVLMIGAVAYAPPPWLSVLNALPRIAAEALP